MAQGKFIDLTGQTFGTRVVIKRVPKPPRRTGEAVWYLTKCGKCGRERVRSQRSISQTNCKCHAIVVSSCRLRTHGLSRHPLINTYGSMISRCHSPSNQGYCDYGGRGVVVCARWRGADGLKNFIHDMGERPKGMSLDRIDNDGDYSKDNCRWATKSQQEHNKRPRIKNAQHDADLIKAFNLGVAYALRIPHAGRP